jgi:hypothetical protein
MNSKPRKEAIEVCLDGSAIHSDGLCNFVVAAAL